MKGGVVVNVDSSFMQNIVLLKPNQPNQSSAAARKLVTQCGHFRNLLSHFFGKHFVKVTFIL